VKSSATAPAQPVIEADTWTQLQTGDLPGMVRHLRERGFPPEFIRAIMAAKLRELYADRMKAIDPNIENRPYWKNFSIDPKVQRAQMQLYREQQKELRALLGEEAEPRENINALFQGLRLETVPAEKLPEVQRILRDFDEARNDIYSSAGGGIIGQEIQKRVEAAQKEQRAALARLLTPQELEEWDLRNSDTARNVRYQLSAFNPTESEFRTIFKLQAEFDERFPRTMQIPNPEEQQRRGEAQRQLSEQIKATLGPARASEYDRANDFNYRQTSQLVARLELPAETTNQVYEVQNDIRKKMTNVMRENPGEAERAQQLAQLEAETQTRVTAILGTRGFEAYRQYGGSWMQSLRPRPAQGPAMTAPAR
jgi:hypothetical protein